jgi:hypothetical protein
MSFSKLPPELKTRIVLFAKLNDSLHRVSNELTDCKEWDGWFGRSTLALAGVNKVMRELALPRAIDVRSASLLLLRKQADFLLLLRCQRRSTAPKSPTTTLTRYRTPKLFAAAKKLSSLRLGPTALPRSLKIERQQKRRPSTTALLHSTASVASSLTHHLLRRCESTPLAKGR